MVQERIESKFGDPLVLSFQLAVGLRENREEQEMSEGNHPRRESMQRDTCTIIILIEKYNSIERRKAPKYNEK